MSEKCTEEGCTRAFVTKQGLYIHMNRTHGVAHPSQVLNEQEKAKTDDSSQATSQNNSQSAAPTNTTTSSTPVTPTKSAQAINVADDDDSIEIVSPSKKQKTDHHHNDAEFEKLRKENEQLRQIVAQTQPSALPYLSSTPVQTPTKSSQPTQSPSAQSLQSPSSQPSQPDRKRKRSSSSTNEATPSPQKVVPEKRLAHIRKMSQAVRERIDRALSQRLYLISRTPPSEDGLEQTFTVLGSVGNVYTIKINKTPSCDCPDFQKGNLCKHILFIYLRVLKVPRYSDVIPQKALLTTELKYIFSNAPRDPSKSVVAGAAVRKKFNELTGQTAAEEPTVARRKLEPGNCDCPICYEEMTAKDDLVWCQSSCGNNVHRDCFKNWANSKRKGHESVTCVFCRAEWVDTSSGGQPKAKRNSSMSNEGYLNLATFQPDCETERDTSTYHRRPWDDDY